MSKRRSGSRSSGKPSPGARSSGKPARGKSSGRPPRGARPQRKDESRTKPPERSPASHSRSGGQVPEEFTDAERGERLQKVLADAGIASRRDCEKLIANGQVRVNRKLVSALPAWVDPANDRITVDGRPVHVRADAEKAMRDRIYVAVNKPRRVISTVSDPEGRRTVSDLVDYPGNPRLYPVGRLDADSTGLILLTNDGDLTQRLTHPKYGVDKEYEVVLKGRLEDSDIDRLKKGLFLTGRRRDPSGDVDASRAKMEDVVVMSRGRGKAGNDRTRVRITLREGKNREIRRLLARLEFDVHRLERIRIGPLKLKGIASGSWRKLTGKEVAMLRRVAGIR